VIIFDSIDSFDFPASAITIGAFDGVHEGHVSVIRHLQEAAGKKNIPSVILTFQNHPQFFFNPHSDFKLLTTIDEKTTLLNQTGIDALVFMPFDNSIASMPYCEFVKSVLHEKLRAKHIIMGYDHRFGKGGEGTFPLVKECAKDIEIDVEQASELNLGEHLSSSRIRKALAEGNVAHAAKLLGYYYGFDATVVHGRQLGRNIGFPTANLSPLSPDKLLPSLGVYVVKIYLENKVHVGMLNFGVKPTIDKGLLPTAEVHIFNFQDDIYGKNVRVEFLDRIRDEMKFSSLDELRTKISHDKEVAEKILLSSGIGF
jgi:riboflavin kinase/FMN adenylyltransferase